MPHDTKIATCCYCGARAALVLTGAIRHELSCAACGAPLRHLKQMPGRHARRGAPHQRPANAASHPKFQRKSSKKPRKSWARWALEEAWDAVEDIFD